MRRPAKWITQHDRSELGRLALSNKNRNLLAQLHLNVSDKAAERVITGAG
jgi:hypothetical protein